MEKHRIKQLIAAYHRAEALTDREWRNPARPSGGITQRHYAASLLAFRIANKLPAKVARQVAPDRIF
jgi:hypothetical protein